MRPRTTATLAVAATLAVLAGPGGGCSVPSDSEDFRYVEPDASAALALGAACDEEHPCAAGLDCRIAMECRRTDPDVAPPASATGGRSGDRCDDERPCAEGFACVPASDVAICTTDCANDADCPEGAVCWVDRGAAENWCVPPGGTLGDACEVENDCAPGLFCENRAAGGYCSKECDTGVPCPAGMDAICTRLSGGFGIYCLQRCTDDRDACREDVECRKMTKADEYVCFPSF